MRILKSILLGLVIVVAILAIIALLLPRRVHVERSTVIEAPPSTVFTLLNGFQSFRKWSPWHDRDPDMTYEILGPETGVGAELRWSSDNPAVGEGSQRIIESQPFSRVRTTVDFGAPGNVLGTFDIREVQNGSTVTWSLDVDFGYHLPGRYFGLFFDQLVGPDYELGLSNLKKLAESLPTADFSDAQIELAELEPVPIAYRAASASPNPTAIIAGLAVAYLEVTAFMELNGLVRQGPPLAIIRRWGPTTYEFDAAIPISSATANTKDSNVQVGETYGGRVVRAVHKGPYKTRTRTHEQVRAFLAARGLEQNGDPWEEFVSDPGSTPADELVTHIYYPIR